MADVNAEIGVSLDTSQTLSQLKALQRQISQFHTSIAKSSETAAIAQRNLQKNFINSINAIGAFSAELRTVRTTAESFTDSLEKNKFSMREYFRYAGASTKTFGKLFKSEFDTIGKVAEDRVKKLQTQYVKMGRDASGAMRAVAIIPDELDLTNYRTQTQLAAQKQAIFNQLVKQGSTNLLNFGKNTQWAGRQLMVGFTLPLITLGTTASRTFMEMEAAALKFRKVYGDLFTPKEETQQALADITALGQMFTKYGIAVSQTVGLAAEAAAAGFQGLDLQRQTTEATRLSVLGQIDSQKALETTISLQNAFKLSSDQLAGSIDFLNAVENQTVVSLDDITTAIPKVAPVIQQLGGDVKDLTFFMAAMKEGGVNASEGANALKSGLAALINPTEKASKMLAAMGINIKQIIETNKGDLKATVISFAQALDTLDPLTRARAIEQLFGKFQFARLSTLFDNVTNQTGQAARVLDLAGTSIEDLAALSESELGMTADSAMNKFRKSVEDLKLALVPVGQTFLEAVTPILDFLGNIVKGFADLPKGVKKVITLLTVGLGAIGPIALMTFGLLANGLANVMKGIMVLRNGYLRLTGQTQVLGEQTDYLTTEQMNAAAVAHSLDQSHARLTQTFTAEAGAVNKLVEAYQRAVTAGQTFAMNNPGAMIPPRGRRKYAKGVALVPGSGNQDTVPAMLTPGEAVIPKDMVQKYGTLINGMIADNIPGYARGTGKVAGSIFGTNVTLSRRDVSRAVEDRIAELDDIAQAEILSQIPDIAESLKDVSLSVEVFANELKKRITEGTLALKKSQLGGFAEDEASSAPRSLAKRKAAMKEWDTRAQEMAAKEQLASKYAYLSPEQLRQVGFESGRQTGMGGTSIAHLIPKEAGKAKDWATKTAEGLSRLQAEDTAINAYLNDLSNIGQNFKDKLTSFMKSITTAAEQQTGVVERLAAGQQPKTRREYEILSRVAQQDIATRGLPTTITGLTTQKGYRAEFAGSAAAIRTKSQTYFGPSGEINPYYQNFDPVKTAKKAEADGKSDAISYQKGRKSAGLQDMYEVAAKRNSPYAEAEPDGRSDALAYQKGRRSVTTGTIRPGQPISVTKTGPEGKTVKEIANDMVVLEETIKKETKARITAAERLTTYNRILTGGTFALTSLAGAASMVPGPLGQLSQEIMKYSGLLFGLITVTQLLTQEQFALLAANRLSKAQTVVKMARGGGGIAAMPGLVGKSGIFGSLARAGLFVTKFLGPIGLATTALFAGYKVIQMVNAAREKERLAIEGLADAMKTTAEQTKALGDFFGVVPNKLPFDIGQREVVGAQQRSQRETLKASAGFKDTFKNTIQTLSQSTAEEAKLVFTSLALNLKAQGFATEQIQTIIDALREEAGKTDVKLDVKSLTLGTESVKTIKTDLNNILAEYAKEYGKQAPKVIKTRGAGGTLVEITQMSGGLRKQMETLSTFVAESSKSLSGMFELGLISQEEYQNGLIAITEDINKMDAAQRTLLLTKVFEKLNISGTAFLKTLTTQKQQMMALALISAGMLKEGDPILKALQSSNDQTRNRGLIQLNRRYGELAKVINKATEETKENNQVTGDGESAYSKAIAALKEQKTQLIQSQQAYSKLKKAGIETGKAFEVASDPILAAAIATTKVGTPEWKALLTLIKDVNKELLKSDLLKFFEGRTEELDLKKQFAAIIPLLKELGLDAKDIEDIFANPDLAREFIKDLKDGVINSEQLAKYIKEIPELKKIDIILGITEDNAKEELRRKADELFGFLERAAEREFKRPIAAAEKAVKDAENVIQGIQDRIDKIQTTIDTEQRNIEVNITRKIEGFQENINDLQRTIEIEFNRKIEEISSTGADSIEKLQRQSELQFERPIAALQEESSDLANSLTLMDKAAESINKKYDDQANALSKVSEINQDIVNQQKNQLGLADALTQGDIAAAAKAAQEMRATEAQASIKKAQDNLAEARQTELDRLRAANGMTRQQIEARQFQISQQIFTLEEQREALQAKILVKQDQVYTLEQARSVKLLEIRDIEDKIYNLEEDREAKMLLIRGYEDEIYNIKIKELVPAQETLDTANNTLKAVKEQLKARLDNIEAQKDAWEAEKDAELAAKIAAGEYNDVITATLGLLGSIEQKWKDIKKAADDAAAALAKSGGGAGGGASGGGGGGGASGGSTTLTPAAAITAIQSARTNSEINKAVNDAVVVGATASNIANAMASSLIKSGVDTTSALSSARYTGQAIAWQQAQEAAAKKAAEDAKALQERLFNARMKARSSGGMINTKYFAFGGTARGTDTIPAMLTPGEFVMSKYAVKNFGVDNMKAINNGEYEPSKVYNYNLNVNVKSDANPDDIARTVITQIRQIDSQRIRGQRVS